MTLDDLERPKRHSCGNKVGLRSPPEKINEDRPKLSAAECRSMILVSTSVRFVRIFAGVPQWGSVKRQRRCLHRPSLP